MGPHLPRTEGSLLPRRTRITTLLVGSAVVALSLGTGGPTVGAPTVDELRAEVARIQAEVADIDQQVGLAAEAYNGAVYTLGQVNDRITKNTAALKRSNVRLKQTQNALAVRVRAAYVRPQPSQIQLLLTRTSTSELGSAQEILRRTANQDRQIVTAVRDLRNKRVEQRKQLVKDQANAKKQVAQREEQKRVVEGLLARRQAVLSSAKGRLAQELEAERRREAARRAEANRRAQARVRAEQAARRTQERSTPSTPAPSASPSPAASAPSAPSSPSTGSSSGGSSRNAQAAQVAMQYLGVPYVWGGSSPSGFDCSGLAMYAYGKVGVSMAHYTGAIWSAFPKVSGDLQPGDLVFFSGLGHMGIYIGGGQMVHAPHTGDVVRVASISRSGYVGAVRP